MGPDEDFWDSQLGVCEACTLRTAENDKSGLDNCGGFPYTGSSLHINSQHCNQGQKFAKIKYVFRGDSHWSDKCSSIMEPKARKNFLKEKGFCFLCLKSSHVSRNSPEKKPVTIAKVCITQQFVKIKVNKENVKVKQMILTIKIRHVRPSQIALRI